MKAMAFFLLTVALIQACTPSENTKPAVYDGPLRVMEQVDRIETERELLKSRLKAAKIIEYVNGDYEFPEGIYLEFYNELGKLSSTLSANTAYFFKAENKWRGRGKVEVKNLEKDQQLNTEELFWKPDTKKIFTDKFVTLRDAGDILYGTGLDAMQDLSNYQLRNISGDLEYKE